MLATDTTLPCTLECLIDAPPPFNRRHTASAYRGSGAALSTEEYARIDEAGDSYDWWETLS